MQQELPKDVNAELAVIGCCLVSKQALVHSLKVLSEESFYDSNHKIIFNAIKSVVAKDQSVDLVTVSSTLGADIDKIGGISKLTEACSSFASTQNINSYLNTLETKKAQRRAIALGSEIMEMGYKGETDLGIKIRNKAVTGTEQNTSDAVFTDTLIELERQREEFRENLKTGKKIVGHSTGIAKLDKALLGVRKGKFGVIGGQTSAGKTQLTLNIINTMLKDNARILFMSIEMSNVDVMSRMIAIDSGQDIDSVLLGYNVFNDMELTEQQRLKIQISEAVVCKYQLKINQNSNWSFLNSRISEIEALGNFDVLVIDFIQNIEDSEEEYKKLNIISNRLQSFAKNTGCIVLATSQISRDAQTSKRVDTSVFKGSGGIAEKSDFAIVLSYDKKYTEDDLNLMKATRTPLPITLNIVKNRGGQTGAIDMRFETHTGRFLEGDEFSDL